VEGKRITKFLIVSVVIIVTILSITINSEFALASATGNNATTAIKPNEQFPFGDLHVENIFRVNCPSSVPDKNCPQESNTYTETTVTFADQTHNIPGGSCCPYTTVSGDFHVPDKAKYTITTSTVKYVVGKEVAGVPVVWFTFDEANIQGTPPFGTGGCTGKEDCSSTMGVGEKHNVIVNYHWSRFP
jgi:hypothetical protein